MAINYQSVIDQMTSHGLIIRDGLTFGKAHRCHTTLDREKRGWYYLHEVKNNNGDMVIIGGYGIWTGNENNAQKIEFEKTEFTDEQKRAFAARLADDKKRSEQQQQRLADSAARKAVHAFENYFTESGYCDYLKRKNVGAYGVRFSDKNSMAIPMIDRTGQIKGLQIILDRQHNKDRIAKIGRDKEYFPTGMQKKGAYHQIGTPDGIIIIAEGYATGATLHEITNKCVIIAFDANNITHVTKVIRSKYRECKIIIAADSDTYQKCANCGESVNVDLHPSDCNHCEQPHKKKNAGVEAATLAAMEHGCACFQPVFKEESARFDNYKKNKTKLTDFNDLCAIEGQPSVLTQFEQACRAQGWRFISTRAGVALQGGGENYKPVPKPITSTEELLSRFVLVQHMGGMMFDKQYHKRCMINDMKQLCTHSDIPKRYFESKTRVIVEEESVGFDPTERNPLIKASGCNTWDGWPTVPTEGKCEQLLELLQYMCMGESNNAPIYQWMLRWLAYPIQNPGAKMKTTVVIHGPQGTGKNLFFDCILEIYGKYGRVIDQSAIEDKFNDCFSGKLFMLADEVVARSDLYHIKNKLKGLITGDRIRINPKNMAAYEEQNHVNLVFLSNERVPVVIEQDDRRHQVLWTPEKLGPDFYEDVAREIASGGVAALHHYLKTLDLGDFNPHTKPIMTEAKGTLIDLCKGSVARFYEAWTAKEIDDVEPIPCRSDDLYVLYNAWCKREGLRSAPKNKAIDEISKTKGVRKERKRYFENSKSTDNPKTIIYPHNCPEQNLSQSESIWLGDHIANFKLAVTGYAGGNYA
jgi:putative DNA primase/helicase